MVTCGYSGQSDGYTGASALPPEGGERRQRRQPVVVELDVGGLAVGLRQREDPEARQSGLAEDLRAVVPHLGVSQKQAATAEKHHTTPTRSVVFQYASSHSEHGGH
eukprot:2244322-Pyramimonas_sp.AAC.1